MSFGGCIDHVVGCRHLLEALHRVGGGLATLVTVGYVSYHWLSFPLHLHHLFWRLYQSCDLMPLFVGSSASCQWRLRHIIGGCVISLVALHRIIGRECEKAALT